MSWLPSKYFNRTCFTKRKYLVHVDNCEKVRTVGICSRFIPDRLEGVIPRKAPPDVTNQKLRFIRTLLIDNYDSYTYNIFQELSIINGVPPVVVRNDEWQWEDAYHYLYKEKAFDNIVISPGPGSPTCPADIGICLTLLLQCRDIPVLGVCLGHQALGFVHGAKVVHASEPIHGRLSDVEHNSCSLFHGIPSGRNSGFKVVRYHSLVVDPQSLPKELVPIAWTSTDVALPFLGVQGALDRQSSQPVCFDSLSVRSRTRRSFTSFDNGKMKNEKVLMGIMHTSRPHYGLQFHPESVATCHGRMIFKNFAEITRDYWIGSGTSPRADNQMHHAACVQVPHVSWVSNGVGRIGHPVNDMQKNLGTHNAESLSHSNSSLKFLKLTWKKLSSWAGRVGGARNIFCQLFGQQKGKDTFWLDSCSVEKKRARFSFMGAKGGALWKQIIFKLPIQSDKSSATGGQLTIEDAQGSKKSVILEDGFFDFLNKELHSLSYDKKDFEGLPFDFHGGYIGYIGYDLKVECGVPSNRHKSTAPDACFFFADNFLVIDHDTDDIYIMSVNDKSASRTNWLADTEQKILKLEDSAQNLMLRASQDSELPISQLRFAAKKSKEQYITDVERCQRLIRDGLSYELCLTTQLKKKTGPTDPLGLYLHLREKNPAPYAAWLNFSSDDLSICSSSPERFLRLDRNGILEAKPIKGTIARGLSKEEDELLRLQLQYSEKDQAENLMIVDLLRNDLGRVCEPGTVHVPHLMDIESYATVHTMVSTVRGEKRSNLSPIDCVRAAFPGGSMTGAPKLRSMELLDSLENSSRGVYSGCIGYFSYSQTFDLNIVIRTVVIHKNEASIGAGGAITALSNPEEEYEEMILKTKAPANAVYEYESNSLLVENIDSQVVA